MEARRETDEPGHRRAHPNGQSAPCVFVANDIWGFTDGSRAATADRSVPMPLPIDLQARREHKVQRQAVAQARKDRKLAKRKAKQAATVA